MGSQWIRKGAHKKGSNSGCISKPHYQVSSLPNPSFASWLHKTKICSFSLKKKLFQIFWLVTKVSLLTMTCPYHVCNQSSECDFGRKSHFHNLLTFLSHNKINGRNTLPDELCIMEIFHNLSISKCMRLFSDSQFKTSINTQDYVTLWGWCCQRPHRMKMQ